MMKKLTHNTVAAAGLAALFLLGACASTNDDLREADDVVEVRPEQVGQSATVAPAPGPAKVDSDGNIYSSSNAPGMGNPSTVGTNTNVNIIPERSSVEVRETSSLTTVDTTVDTTADVSVDTAPVVTTPTVTTIETRTETTTVPMTSSVQSTTTTDDDDDDTTTTTTTTRTRMRKD